jgi:hypothetical protein
VDGDANGERRADDAHYDEAPQRLGPVEERPGTATTVSMTGID